MILTTQNILTSENPLYTMKKAKIIITVLIIAICSALSSHSQCQPSKQDRNAWMKEMRQVKNDYISRKLNLTAEQKNRFLPLYNKMEREVNKCVEEAQHMAHLVKEKRDNATDLEYEKAAEALFECKAKEGEIELKYYREFKKILTPKQLFILKRAEREFTKTLMREHRKMKREKKQNDNKQ